MNFTETYEIKGTVHVLLEYKNKLSETLIFPNKQLQGGMLMANFLAGQGNNVFIKNMLFGDGGFDQENEIKKPVNPERNSLFGITRVSKPVVAQIDPAVLTRCIFTSVITFDEGNGYTLNEMALQLSNENLFSMATFPNLSKTNEVQMTYNWLIEFV